MTHFITNSTTRRSFLRAGSSVIAIPFLETFASAAASNKTPPKRVIFLGGGFGFTADTFYPKQAGRFSEIGLTEGLAPLQRHQDDITMVANMTNIGATDPHGGSVSYLTGANVEGTPGKRFHNSISCDQLIARHLGSDTRFASLTLSANEADGGQNSGHGKGLSLAWDDSGNPIPGINRPIDLYFTLFASRDDAPDKVHARLKEKQSILDIVKINAGSMKRTLGKDDQDKLDEYFTGVRQVETGLERQAKWADIPKPNAPFEAPDEGLTGEEAIKLMYDMMIIALQTDAVRVVSYRLPVCSLLSSIGIKLQAHSLSHYGFSQPRIDASRQRDQKCMGLLAHFIDRLKEAKDIDGSRLYDNCIVSYGTNIRSGHELKNVPAILTGGGAKDIRHGRNIVLPKEDTPLANYWLTLIQQAGVPVEQFSHSTGVISELCG
ncbi:DUF1552 domain-containing protein [Neorhodopirellula pilleata]|uniref:DUF1552 domain-containing protein n=1 Tax=Neorhodopirellula pilleata TaxID=2714738 RepID=A0A5C5ZXY0_9BACT|nr:DUF1552 domain-containing protein [Neorhodopirellula pilleata]TWT92512.1 hypothetical protein Pla100_45300 [Neorhodopirellula pilleata]